MGFLGRRGGIWRSRWPKYQSYDHINNFSPILERGKEACQPLSLVKSFQMAFSQILRDLRVLRCDRLLGICSGIWCLGAQHFSNANNISQTVFMLNISKDLFRKCISFCFSVLWVACTCLLWKRIPLQYEDYHLQQKKCRIWWCWDGLGWTLFVPLSPPEVTLSSYAQ